MYRGWRYVWDLFVYPFCFLFSYKCILVLVGCHVSWRKGHLSIVLSVMSRHAAYHGSAVARSTLYIFFHVYEDLSIWVLFSNVGPVDLITYPFIPSILFITATSSFPFAHPSLPSFPSLPPIPFRPSHTPDGPDILVTLFPFFPV